jgi:hypothetical protein
MEAQRGALPAGVFAADKALIASVRVVLPDDKAPIALCAPRLTKR